MDMDISDDDGQEGEEDCEEDVVMYDIDDNGAPGDGGVSAGLGIEYESAYLQFESQRGKNDPDPKLTSQSKRRLVNNLRGNNWRLTADLLGERKGVLDGEIVL